MLQKIFTTLQWY